jgi:hypothetical protein
MQRSKNCRRLNNEVAVRDLVTCLSYLLLAKACFIACVAANAFVDSLITVCYYCFTTLHVALIGCKCVAAYCEWGRNNVSVEK